MRSRIFRRRAGISEFRRNSRRASPVKGDSESASKNTFDTVLQYEKNEFQFFHWRSPNQVLTHAARAAAKQLNKAPEVPFQAPLVAARGAREGLWSE